MSAPTPSRTAVSCIIEHGHNEVLICRPSDGNNEERSWEFPCGLMEPEESHEAAMRRVCLARVGLRVVVHTGQPPFVAEYEGKLATFRFFLATGSGDAKPIDYAEVRWVQKGQLCEYDFGKAFGPVVTWYTE